MATPIIDNVGIAATIRAAKGRRVFVDIGTVMDAHLNIDDNVVAVTVAIQVGSETQMATINLDPRTATLVMENRER